MDFIVGAILGLLLGVVILLVLGVILQWLWNTTLPDVLNVKPITTFQAIKLIFIASILFGGHRAVTVDSQPAPPQSTPQASATSGG